jgi:hypothetical protein
VNSVWSTIGKSSTQKTLAWLGSGIVAAAAGGWAVVTYVWPVAHDPTTICAQQGSLAAGHNATGNTIIYTGQAPVSGATSCANTPNK